MLYYYKIHFIYFVPNADLPTPPPPATVILTGDKSLEDGRLEFITIVPVWSGSSVLGTGGIILRITLFHVGNNWIPNKKETLLSRSAFYSILNYKIISCFGWYFRTRLCLTFISISYGTKLNEKLGSPQTCRLPCCRLFAVCRDIAETAGRQSFYISEAKY